MHDIIINGIQEFFYFDIWESFLMLFLILIIMSTKMNKVKLIFHSIMLALLDLALTNIINIPILQQIFALIMYTIYIKCIFRNNFLKSLQYVIQSFFTFFITEMVFAFIYQYIFKIQLVTLNNNLLKFEYMIPLRIMEFVLIYIFYKIFRERGESK